MKNLRTALIALFIVSGSSAMLTGCFVDEDEIFEQVDTEPNNDGTGQETNDDQWD